MSRLEERRKAWLEAQKESLNRNGMARRDASPISTRTAAEAAQTLHTPDTAPSPRDHSTAAGTGVVNFGGRVRDRIEIVAANERDKQKEQSSSAEQKASDQSWLEWNEAYKRKHGHYPPHGI